MIPNFWNYSQVQPPGERGQTRLQSSAKITVRLPTVQACSLCTVTIHDKNQLPTGNADKSNILLTLRTCIGLLDQNTTEKMMGGRNKFTKWRWCALSSLPCYHSRPLCRAVPGQFEQIVSCKNTCRGKIRRGGPKSHIEGIVLQRQRRQWFGNSLRQVCNWVLSTMFLLQPVCIS